MRKTNLFRFWHPISTRWISLNSHGRNRSQTRNRCRCITLAYAQQFSAHSTCLFELHVWYICTCFALSQVRCVCGKRKPLDSKNWRTKVHPFTRFVVCLDGHYRHALTLSFAFVRFLYAASSVFVCFSYVSAPSPLCERKSPLQPTTSCLSSMNICHAPLFRLLLKRFARTTSLRRPTLIISTFRFHIHRVLPQRKKISFDAVSSKRMLQRWAK